MSVTAARPTHDEFVAQLTGGMTRPDLAPFEGSERLRPDGRPKPEFRAQLRRVPNAVNAVEVLATLAAAVAVVGAVIVAGHPLAVVVAVPIIGTLQLRMFVLHHEAAHRLLFSNRRLNDLVGINLLGWLPLGTGSHHYRRGHAHHHRDEFGPKEPDLLLYALYPITPRSLRRKLARDLVGVSAWRIVKPRFTGLVKPSYLALSLRFFAGQALVFGLYWLAGHPWLYLLTWLLPWCTWYQVINRLRAIAEHGGMTRTADRRNTTHHIRQSWPARVLFAPYHVGYHLAHHVDSGIPARNLPRLQRALEEDGYADVDARWPNYRSLWRALASPAPEAAAQPATA
ncbi:fatty acid desaturase [Candidatus Poriferisodalis sp.]|uniref:fatty acid desaturase n=1 Tax=Candidatus Poriferisodalis sp. TaxID=3101277 RepID=UPI003B0137B7